MGDTNGRTGPRATRVRVLQSAGLVIALVITSAPVSLESALGQDATCETAEFASSDSPKAIPDRGTAQSTISVPQGSPIQDVDVHVDITHPFDSDIRIKLVSPSGKKVLLAEGLGTWGDDFSDTTLDDEAETSIVSSLPPFSGRYRPVEALAAFAGTPSGGIWKLKVTDLRARYAGQLEGWGLTLVTCPDASRTRKRAGAPDPPPLPEGVPVGHEPIEGTLLTVTTNSDASNGDVSTVQALETSPGPDGISLREAIEATNNDPGTYTVRFDSSLAGATIAIHPVLPALRGGGVFIDGDIDGDGRPDVTLVAAIGGAWGLNVVSSGNRLHALAVRSEFGVLFTAMRSDSFPAPPPLRGRRFARNVVSGLVFTDVAAPIAHIPTYFHNECERTPCRTRSRWLDTRLVGNTIESQKSGAIWLGWQDDNGDVMRRVTVAGNRIRVGPKPVGEGLPDGTAINVAVGYARASDNRISDALVAYNAIETRGGNQKPLQVLAGQQGRSGNVVEDVRIVGNRVRSTGRIRPPTEGIVIAVSDDCWPPGGGVPCDNVVRRVEVVGNVLEGQYVGVHVGEPCCGSPGPSSLTEVRIAANVIKSIIAAPTEYLNPWGIVIGAYPVMSDISVDSNTIVQRTTETKAYAAHLTAGGIAVVGGLERADASVRRVSVTNNRVSTRHIGIIVLGGGPMPDPNRQSGESRGQENAVRNRVLRVKIRGNVITRVPLLATRWFSKIKGISLIGGLGGAARPSRTWKARKNKVACVTVRRNIVAGKRNKIAVLPNLGAGASRNVARLGGC